MAGTGGLSDDGNRIERRQDRQRRENEQAGADCMRLLPRVAKGDAQRLTTPTLSGVIPPIGEVR
jgi:hypothetical protein